jgi:multiple sugar transport system ATP-binding protein
VIVRIEGLSKDFLSLRGRVRALRGVSLAIDDGELFVLLGPSGSGKSTLLNLIAGLEKPSAGRIVFGEQTVVDVEAGVFRSPAQRNVAFVFQSYALYPHLDVYRNIAFPLKIAHRSRADIARAVHRTAELLCIEDLLSARPAELSGGQRQRVAIARAIVREPSVFLLDEPLSNLDAQLRGAMRAELKNLQKRLGVTTVYVTHDQVEAMSLGDRIAVLRDGGVEQVGRPMDLYDRPASAFVGAFLGSPPMNLLPSELVEKAGGGFVKLLGHEIRIPTQRLEDFRRAGDKQVIVGLRPEDVGVTAPSEQADMVLTVISVEPQGRETIVRLAAEGDRVGQAGATLIALTERSGISPGERVGVRLDLSRAHAFRTEQ